MVQSISRRAIHFLVLVTVTTTVFTVAYNAGMATWEDRPQSMIQSLEVVFQSFTTTGYGQDAPWETTPMNLLVIGMQLAGVGLILAAINAFVVPWFQTMFQLSPPTRAVEAEDHVLVCGYTPRTESFATELENRDRNFVVLESDEATATELHEDGWNVVHGDPESVDALERAGADRAGAVIVDGPDDVNASVVLSIRELTADVPVITVVEDRELAEYQRLAGADEQLSPRQLLGESLATRVQLAVTTSVGETVTIGDDLELVEISIGPESQLCDRRLGDCSFEERFGVSIVGAWEDDTFTTAVDLTRDIDSGTRLLLAGDPTGIEALEEDLLGTATETDSSTILIAGYGESGAAAHEALAGTKTNVTVLDIEPKSAVDVVGDARDPDVLREAGVEDVDAVVVTVADDTTAIFTTLILQDLTPEVDIFVRAIQEENVPKLVRAGATDVQSLATTSGRMIAATVFENELSLPFDSRVRILTANAADLPGESVAAIERKTDASVLAIRSDEETRTQFDADDVDLAPTDQVVIGGTDQQISSLERTFLDRRG